MSITFACPSCGATGSVDVGLVGKIVRCKHCRERFAIPDPDVPEADGYALEEPAAPKVRDEPREPEPRGESVFVSSRGDEEAAPGRRRRSTPSPQPPPRRIKNTTTLPWMMRMVRLGGVLAVVLTLVALFAPGGMKISGSVLVALGGLMVLAGYAAGAYGAFSEDFLHGALYLTIPLYTGYYILTRWDDLWVWFTCSTVGVVLATIGAELLQWAGVDT